jgi:glycosyltransferase involved in cell wall biosynthesis
MNSDKIAVSGVGNPLSESTWSGTPFKLCEELKAMGRLGPVYDADDYALWPIPRLMRVAARIYYRNSHESSRGIVTRAFRAKGLQRFLDRNPVRHVLHIGSLALPLIHQKRRVDHHLFCDSTWHLWSTYSTNRAKCRPSLIRDGERLEREVYRQMTRIFSISEYVKADLIECYSVSPEKITVVGTGRGAITPYHGDKNYKGGNILFVAKDRFRDKGGDLLVKAFEIAAAKNSSLHLILAGNESYKELTHGRPNIAAYGYITLEQLQKLFNEAALFAMPAFNEPWGLVYLEALSCRSPVLGLKRNAIPEITRNGAFGFCVPEPTAESVAQTILNAFSNLDRLASMGRDGQEYVVREFSWKQTVSRMLNAIDSTAEDAPRNRN